MLNLNPGSGSIFVNPTSAHVFFIYLFILPFLNVFWIIHEYALWFTRNYWLLQTSFIHESWLMSTGKLMIIGWTVSIYWKRNCRKGKKIMIGFDYRDGYCNIDVNDHTTIRTCTHSSVRLKASVMRSQILENSLKWMRNNIITLLLNPCNFFTSLWWKDAIVLLIIRIQKQSKDYFRKLILGYLILVFVILFYLKVARKKMNI